MNSKDPGSTIYTLTKEMYDSWPAGERWAWRNRENANYDRESQLIISPNWDPPGNRLLCFNGNERNVNENWMRVFGYITEVISPNGVV